jgi:hypothetical protein
MPSTIGRAAHDAAAKDARFRFVIDNPSLSPAGA